MSRTAAVDRLIQVERAELGAAEQPPGSNRIRYNTDYYGRPVSGASFAWCVVFQWWCMQHAGIPTSVFPKANNVFAVRDWYRRRGRFFASPLVGDLVIFSRSHIGLVEKTLTGDRIQTIEGNSSDRVARRVYPARTPAIQGYCRPEYHHGPGQPAPPPVDPLPARAGARGGVQYTIRRGDTLSELAVRFRTSVPAIVKANRDLIDRPDRIQVGWVLTIPSSKPIAKRRPVRYTVRPGDTLSGIARRFGTTIQQLMRWNKQITNANVIRAGWQLRVR